MRFDQCTETCTTDCGHCKGRPVEAMRAELLRQLGLREIADNWAAWHAKAQAAAEAERDALLNVYTAAKAVVDNNLLTGCGSAWQVLADAVGAVGKEASDGSA